MSNNSFKNKAAVAAATVSAVGATAGITNIVNQADVPDNNDNLVNIAGTNKKGFTLEDQKSTNINANLAKIDLKKQTVLTPAQQRVVDLASQKNHSFIAASTLNNEEETKTLNVSYKEPTKESSAPSENKSADYTTPSESADSSALNVPSTPVAGVVNTVAENTTVETVNQTNTSNSSSQQKEIKYTVKSGDSLWGIANQFGVSVEDLVNANGGSSLITVGQVLIISQGNSVNNQENTSNVVQEPSTPSNSTASQPTAPSVAPSNAAPSSSVPSNAVPSSSAPSVAPSNATPSSAPSSSAPSNAVPSTPTTNMSAAQKATFDAMNILRAQHGLKAVQWDADLAAKATQRAAQTNATQSVPSDHYAGAAGPEVIAIGWSYGTPVINAWFIDDESVGMYGGPGHRNWLLNPNATKVGFGVVGNVVDGISNSWAPATTAPAGATISKPATTKAAGAIVENKAVKEVKNQNIDEKKTDSVVANYALKLASLNIPFAQNGDNINGLDASGLVSYVVKNTLNEEIPHNTVLQEGYVTKKELSKALPGDLLFWGTAGSTYHVGIFVGNGQFVSAQADGVVLEKLTDNNKASFAGSLNN
jgi:LysM repeat protein